MDLSGKYICIKSISFSFRVFERNEIVNIIKSGLSDFNTSYYYAENTFGTYLDENIICDCFKPIDVVRLEKINKLINGRFKW